jgi:hypothetical protein
VKLLQLIPALILLVGCANTSTMTAKTVGTQEAAYRACVKHKALPLAPSPEPTAVIVREAAKQCEKELQAVYQALLVENERATYAGRFASNYTDSLKARSMREASLEIEKRRTQQ